MASKILYSGQGTEIISMCILDYTLNIKNLPLLRLRDKEKSDVPST